MASKTLIDLLEATGAKVRIYDMGRRVTKITRETFRRFEQTDIPWPTPLARQAWLALFMRADEISEPVIWFLRFPLDEQGKLLQSARDYFIHRLIEAWQHNQQEDNQDPVDALKDNPYVFKPREERMAVFHAKISRDLKNEASQYFEPARNYFGGKEGWDNWQFVGYQGIADLAARFGEDENTALIAAAVPELPAEPLVALCHCLENEQIPHAIGEALYLRLSGEAEGAQPDLLTITAEIRALCNPIAKEIRDKAVRVVLENPLLGTNPEVLAAISGRAWPVLHDVPIRKSFLKSLATNDQGQAFFERCMADLLAIPDLQKALIETASDPDFDLAVSTAFATFQQHISETNS